MHQWAQAQVPVPDFSANRVSGCAPLTVTFKDESTGNPIFWNWDFGNGNLSNVQNPTFTFATPGTYSVTLVVRNANGTDRKIKTDYITVNPSPQPNFSANKMTACAPSTIQFTDLSDPRAGSLVKWEWDFGDGGTSDQRNPSHEYTATGFYTVTLRVTSSTGCQSTSSIARFMRIVPGVVPDFSFSAPATCQAPFNLNFTNLSSGPGTMTYQWNFGNNTNSTDASPTATYAAAGTYTVSLNAVSEFGCINNIQKTVDVTGTGTSFTGPDTICLNTTASFQNTSTTPPLSTTWDFGNGQVAVTKDGSATYPVAGEYFVKMVNTYANCKDSLTKKLVVIDKPTVDFTAPVTAACKPTLDVAFTSAAPNAQTYQWDFGDGGTSGDPNPRHTYTTAGRFNVTLTITTRQGCTNSITKPAFVQIVEPTISFANAPNGGCIPFDFAPIANINSLEPAQTFVWEYGEGAPATTTGPTGYNGPTHRYNTPGKYTIKVTMTTSGGCSVSAELVDGIRTGQQPVVDFTPAPTEVCAVDAITFTHQQTSGATLDEVLWDFGDDSTSTDLDPSHRYIDSGYFDVTLIAYNNKCASAPVIKTVHVKPPIAKFNQTVRCNAAGWLVEFENLSKVNTGVYGPVEYEWDFGDGSAKSNSATPLVPHTYTAAGNYTVTLTVRSLNPGECNNTFSQQLELVNEFANFAVTPAQSCKNEPVTIEAIGSVENNITQYEWSLNHAAFVVQGRSFTTDALAPGTYDLSLIITDINGCKNRKDSVNVFTISGPQAQFTPAVPGGCINNVVTFNDATTSAQTITKWTFDFGDGQTVDFNAGPFTHTYADTGSYVVKMTVLDDKGCKDTYTAVDTVFITKPKAGFTAVYPTICPNTDLPFTDTSSGRGLSWRWDFGDGGTASGQSPTHRYSVNSGTFSVKLVVTDENGCKDSTTTTNYITVKKPVPSFTATDTSSICELLETKFTFQGTDHESFYWDFGDGTTSTLANPRHFYNKFGSYEAKLYVIGYGGCTDSASQMVNVYNPYTQSQMNLNPTESCNSLLVDFSLVTPPATKLTFYPGDGTWDTSQIKVLQHFYKEPGFYPPQMGLQDSLGCLVVVPGPTTIRVIGALPLFGVDKKNFCDQGTVNFANFTIGNDPVVAENWEFGDGATSLDLNPAHTYTSAGTFVVKHNVRTQTGCENTITDTIRIYATPDPQIAGDTIACINEALNLQATLVVPDTAITWKWDLGSNGQSANENVSVKYAQSGTYTVGLEAANKLGCKDNTTRTLYVPPTPTITVAGGNNVTLPVGIGVTLPVTYSDGIATYAWTPARDLSCTNCATPVANPKFTTTYSVRVEDTFGCTATAGVTVTVVCNKENYFVPNTFSPNGDGNNDVFMPRGRSIDRVNRMQIFNRWGELVFEKRNFAVNDKSAGWDGTFKGKPAQADVYVYVIEFVCDNASVIPFRGNVTLLR
ncbi:PKD domain-containing protein [Paraflavitalea pollutisoli]|uniref:PKD domain-containing protein n=1 Tax=Paraflavitalea pollutisoli TaxID=3034143 RepID=UPI0023ED4280|nr:PKD domain-containing protein [Paraflavitalea sp. H1-2-19X]